MSRCPWLVAAAGLVFPWIGLSTPAVAQSTHTVEMVLERFDPRELAARLGDTVHWVWDFDFHNVESGVAQGFDVFHDGRFRSGDPTFGPASFDLLLDRDFLNAHPSPDSTYPYYCLVHYFGGMVGVIEVVVPADVDRDTDVDIADHARWIDCVTGPDESIAPGTCSEAEFDRLDADGDGDVDLQDFAELQSGFTG